MTHLEPHPTLDQRYTYAARVVRIVDGDTVELDLDLGLNIWAREICRLLGIDTEELRGKNRMAGLMASSHLDKLLSQHSSLVVRTHKDKTGKYGRYLVELWTVDGENLNRRMVKDGYARLI